MDARLAQGGADLTGRSADERTDQAFVDRFARHREDPDDRERLRVEAGDPGQEQVDQRWRAREGGGRIRTRSQELLREERMAFGAAPDGSEELVGDRALVHRHELAAHLVLGEPPELDPDRPGRTPQLGQPGADRMTWREVVGSAGQNRDQSLFRDVADEECHEVACRGIDPLDVLEDREHRLFLAEPLEESEEALEQPGTVGRRRGAGAARVERRDLGDQHREIRAGGAEDRAQTVCRHGVHELAERFDEGQVRQRLTLEIEACPVQDRRSARSRAVNRVGDETRLADAGLAPHDRDDGTAFGCQHAGLVEPGQFRLATDGDRARSGRHAADGTTDRP